MAAQSVNFLRSLGLNIPGLNDNNNNTNDNPNDNVGESSRDAAGAATAGATRDFAPPVDIFDTPEAFVLHLPLAGAKKSDIGVEWNPETYELRVAGVIHRPGDEELLKNLAVGEREVGAFERKVKLGSRERPAVVEAEEISARMEDGVLVVVVPKGEAFVEVRKVDVQ